MPAKATSSTSVLSGPSAPSIPPALLLLKDTLEKYPEARKLLLESEIAHRECQVVLLRSHRMLLRLQLWSAFQTALIAGFIIFSVGVALTGLVEVGKFVNRVSDWNASLPTNVLTRGFQNGVASTLPTSTMLQVADYIPFWDLHDATVISLMVALAVLTIRVVQGISNWRASRRLKKGANVLDQEIEVLRTWLNKAK